MDFELETLTANDSPGAAPQAGRQPPPPGFRGQAHATFRFLIEIDGINEAVFSECDLPGLEVDLKEQKEGGYNQGSHQLPGPVKAGKLTLRRGLAVSSELLAWYGQVAAGKMGEARRSISLVMYDSRMTEVMRWNFLEAFPVKWSGPAFKTSENAVAIEVLEIAFAEVIFV